MESLTSDDIILIPKNVLLTKLHSYIRAWYINGLLSQTMVQDKEIIPFFTPCQGHPRSGYKGVSDIDEIDGVLPMQAYCKLCSYK